MNPGDANSWTSYFGGSGGPPTYPIDMPNDEISTEITENVALTEWSDEHHFFDGVSAFMPLMVLGRIR